MASVEAIKKKADEVTAAAADTLKPGAGAKACVSAEPESGVVDTPKHTRDESKFDKTNAPPPLPTPGTTATHGLLERVRKELAGLRKALPQVLSFTAPRFSPAVLLKGRVCPLKDVPDAHKRVFTEVILRGPKQFPGPHRLLLEVPSTYPKLMPDVRFVSSIQHFAVDPSTHRPMGSQFTNLCTNGATAAGPGYECSLRRTLQAVYEFLRRPLHPCQHCTPAFEQSVQAQRNVQDIAQLYQHRFAKHPTLFRVPTAGLQCPWFAPELRSALACTEHRTKALTALLREEAPGIYSFPMFSADYCSKLIAEVDSVAESKIPVQRPNSMNNYGVILNLIGMQPFFTWVQKEVLQPIAALLFHEAGQFLDSHHTFIVQYSPKQDLGLDMHVDNSDVTFNICLGREGFTGAALNFCGVLGQPNHRKFAFEYTHVRGRCVVHLGSKRHGAANIRSGERYNLIIWNTSTVYRASITYKTRSQQRTYNKEEGPPDRVCLSYTHDRDYGRYLTYPEGKERFKATAWCPPTHAEHDEDEDLGDLLGSLT